ncbi:MULTISPECIES: multidrug effflux MFS transporter [unclassified Neptuniibacter]|uniref:multidrug effflux MFS transporter n=1 Tax=uncultured Neptuniibacter sp. TaxID=502143 RepID=UPI000C49919F|nr:MULTISPECIES: multidrug effflux MFS transporter [unclassified Neptuniibacter]MAY43284.1 Bcr/CflA family drug resistance efflux transporter [Oceanospirillaceae bacterium]|tara:strand:- start:16899 stop:18107 length:1209 start_codon:yes stop_codon:yes gene_type:complete
MSSLQSKADIGFTEFVALMAFVTCFVAMAIDLMLPALGVIGADLGVERANDAQLIITTVFLGVAIGQVLYGPLSDIVGRKPCLYLGFSIFIVGTFICLFSTSLDMMLLGRLFQGFGAAGPRIVTIAIVRDQHKGSQMARVMSLIMTVFILVPVVAPIIGQGILLVSGWRAIFAFLLLMALMIVIWLAVRLPETLSVDKRTRLSVSTILAGFKEVLAHKETMAYVIASGLCFGAFLGLLSSVQQVLQDLYELGAAFPFYFAILAAGIGASNFINSKLVMRFGMRPLVMGAQAGTVILSLTALVAMVWLSAVPPLWFLMSYLMLLLLGMGLLFGNLNALAMEPFGHIAGLASSLVGVVSTLIAVGLGTLVGQSFNETVVPLIIGFVLLHGFAFLITRWAVTLRV